MYYGRNIYHCIKIHTTVIDVRIKIFSIFGCHATIELKGLIF